MMLMGRVVVVDTVYILLFIVIYQEIWEVFFNICISTTIVTPVREEKQRSHFFVMVWLKASKLAFV